MRKCANISPYMRRMLVIYDFATASFSISLYMRKFSFLFCHCGKHRTSPTTGTFDVAKSRDVRVGIQQQGNLQHPSDVANSGNGNKCRDATSRTFATP
jgi:hypothetical protein